MRFLFLDKDKVKTLKPLGALPKDKLAFSIDRTADGVTRGAYSYVDSNGIVQSVNYEADSVNGFRVAGTNLPVGPAPVAVAAPVAGKRYKSPRAPLFGKLPFV